MTTKNKIPAHWADGLKMADAIAEIVKRALHWDKFSVRSELYDIGKLVGLTDEELDEESSK